MKSYPRARFAAAVAVAFVCGLVFASGMDLTQFSWAQGRVTSSGAAQVPAPAVASLVETQNAFEAIVDRVKPAVVSIHVTRFARETAEGRGQRGQQNRERPRQNIPPGLEDFMRQFGDQLQIPDPGSRPAEGSGSGFLVSRDGYILTNNHVIADMDRVSVTLPDKRTFDAKVIGRDPTTDVAVIKIEGNSFPFMALGDESTARVGQWVLAIGNPLELEFTVTAGIISAKNRRVDLPRATDYAITDFIQTDAAINPGNSGGPLVNIRGEVIGINSAIASGTGFYNGYGFAIPIGLAKTVMNDLIEYGEVKRAIVGVSLQEVEPEDAEAAGLKEIRGAKVQEFTSDDSPAKKAGIEIGDVITAVDGKPVTQVNSLQRIIRSYRIGQTVKVEVMRFGQRKEFNIRLAEARPTAATSTPSIEDSEPNTEPAALETKQNSKLGLTLSAVPASLARQANIPSEARTGLLIRDVAQRGPSFQRVGTNEIIDEVLYPVRRDIKSVSDLEQALSNVKSGQVVTLRLYSMYRNGNTARTVSIRVP
jgi:serine protease Do